MRTGGLRYSTQLKTQALLVGCQRAISDGCRLSARPSRRGRPRLCSPNVELAGAHHFNEKRPALEGNPGPGEAGLGVVDGEEGGRSTNQEDVNIRSGIGASERGPLL